MPYICSITLNYYTMIEVDDFSYTYGKSRHRVFNGLNLSFKVRCILIKFISQIPCIYYKV